jgi:DNA-binding NarL/FixJ family response regulator
MTWKYHAWTTAEADKVKELRQRGAKISDIAEQLGLSATQIRGILNKRGITVLTFWSEREDEILLEMTACKASAREIGKALGRTRDSVNQRRYNLRKRKKEPDA